MKDGIHIHYPFVWTTAAAVKHIRQIAIGKLVPIIKEMNNLNTVDEVVDKCVQGNNSWYLYGSGKSGREPYLARDIYNMDMIRYDPPPNDIDLLTVLSVRNQANKNLIFSEKIIAPISILGDQVGGGVDEPAKPAGSVPPTLIGKLVQLIDIGRTPGKEEMTIKTVGLCLSHLDPDNFMIWHDFARKLEPYDYDDRQKQWQSHLAEHTKLGGATIYRMAETDHPVEFHKIMNVHLQEVALKSADGTTTKVARVLFEAFKYKFKCVDLVSNIWYEFVDHRWKKCSMAHSLMSLISSMPSRDIVKIYMDLLRTLHEKSQVANVRDAMVRDEFIAQTSKLHDVVKKLHDIKFKSMLIEECKFNGFLDEGLIARLDSDGYLLGCNNGVLDLHEGCFRDGRPEDEISMSTKIDFRSYDLSDPIFDHINLVYSQWFPDPVMCEYIKNWVAMLLEGTNPGEKMWEFIGDGRNGKSKFASHMDDMLGDYSVTINSSNLTCMKPKPGAADPEMIRIKGAHLVKMNEMEKGSLLNAARVKELTGNDPITVRGLYMNPITFTPMMKMAVLCNYLAKGSADDRALWERRMVTEFKSRFVDVVNPNSLFKEFLKDKYLIEKMGDWSQPMLFSSFIRYQKIKSGEIQIVVPQCILDATQRFQCEQDFITEFCMKRLVADNGSSIKISSLWAAFGDWFKITYNTHKIPYILAEFKRKLEEIFGPYPAVTGWIGWKYNIE
jgi:putative DNA primase/helicase